MQMGRLERSEQRDVLFTEGRAVAGHAETDGRDRSTARWIDGYPHRSAGGREAASPPRASIVTRCQTRSPSWISTG